MPFQRSNSQAHDSNIPTCCITNAVGIKSCHWLGLWLCGSSSANLLILLPTFRDFLLLRHGPQQRLQSRNSWGLLSPSPFDELASSMQSSALNGVAASADLEGWDRFEEDCHAVQSASGAFGPLVGWLRCFAGRGNGLTGVTFDGGWCSLRAHATHIEPSHTFTAPA